MHPRDPRPARVLATLFACGLVLLGIATMHGDALLAQAGPGARSTASLGGLPIALGALTLSLWMRSPRLAAAWACACTAVFFVLLASLLPG